MPDRLTPEEFATQIETKTEVSTLNPAEEIKSAQEFFRGQGLSIDEAGLVSPKMTGEQLQELQKWHRDTKTTGGGVDMPTEETFYKKVLLGVSLWRQEQGGKTNYLMGKGVGVEISLRGTISGRTKRPVNFPYRSHSDFELYAAYNPEEGEEAKKKVYTPQFLQVFGSQEYFPSTDTKGLKNLPPRLLYDTAEIVDLGGISVKVPQLELQFLDKWNSAESTPRAEGNDAELLAKQYVLDRELVRKYLLEFVIQPHMAKSEEVLKMKTARQFESITRLLRGMRKSLEEENLEITTENMVVKLSEEIGNFLGDEHVSVGGIDIGYWIPIEASQIDLEGNIIDQELKQQIEGKIQTREAAKVQRVVDREKQMDALFDKIEGKKVQ